MSTVYVESVGLFAPGLVGWQASQPILTGQADYQYQALPRYKPRLLPANERRRASAVVRLAFGACEDAVADQLAAASQLAAVFASSGGDYAINDQICRAVLADEKAVSPTQFHNSVHNAAAGYWSIASNSRQTSVSLSAFDHSVAAGLIEACTLVAVEQLPVLLVCCDVAVVKPMEAKRQVLQPFAAALWLTPEASAASLAGLELSVSPAAVAEPVLANQAVDFLYRDNPAARLLPLLELLAAGRPATTALAMAGHQSVQLALHPC